MFQQLTIPIFQKPECLETEIEWFDKISESSQTEDVPSIIRKIIEDRECVIVLSISGGKDSQAAQAFILHLRTYADTLYIVVGSFSSLSEEDK